MGILTNLIELGHQQAAERRREEMGLYSQILQFAGQPNVDPQAQEKLTSYAIDQILGLADKKSAGPLKEVGGMFKGLIGKQRQSQARQGFQQVLGELGQRPGTTLNIPGGSQVPGQTIGGGGPGPVIGGQEVPAPPQIQTPGVNMSQMLPPRQEQIGPVSPKLLLSPQEQFKLDLDKVRETERVKNEMADIFQAHRDQMEVDKQDRLDKQTLKSFEYYKNVFKGAGLSDREAEDRAGSLLGRPMPRDTVAAVTGRVEGSDSQLQAWGKANGVPIDPEKSYVVERQGRNIVQAFEAASTKGTEIPAGAPRDIVWARTVLADDAAAKKTGGKSKWTDAQVQAAKDVLTKENRPPIGVIQMGEAKSEAEDVAAAIMRGEQPPTVSGFGMARLAPKVRQILAKNNFNLAQAELDWIGMQQYYRSLNSAQQLRLRQATEFATESLNLIHNPKDQGNDLIGQLRRFIPRTKFPIFNKAALAAARQGTFGDAAASAARQFDVQIADLQAELATVYRGGNAATNASLERATQMLAGEWSENTLRDAVDLAQKNLGIRLNSIRNVGPGAPGGGGAYAPPPETPAPVSTTPINRAAPPPSVTKTPKTADEFNAAH